MKADALWEYITESGDKRDIILLEDFEHAIREFFYLSGEIVPGTALRIHELNDANKIKLDELKYTLIKENDILVQNFVKGIEQGRIGELTYEEYINFIRNHENGNKLFCSEELRNCILEKLKGDKEIEQLRENKLAIETKRPKEEIQQERKQKQENEIGPEDHNSNK